MVTKIAPLIQLLRPVNGIIGMIAVFIGALLSHKRLPSLQLILACLACFLIISAGNAINDWVDAEIDITNKPKRPIPAGKITKSYALIISVMFFLLGLMISLKISLPIFIVALFASLLLLIYNFKLKKMGLYGNLLVAGLGGLPFVYGGIVVHSWRLTLMPFLFAFLLHMGREILKDIEDMKGDKVVKSVSFPIKYGNKKAIRLVVLSLSILILFTPLPYLIQLYGIFYFIAVLVCMDLPLIFIICRLLKDESFVHKAGILLKSEMIIGLVVLFLGYW